MVSTLGPFCSTACRMLGERGEPREFATSHGVGKGNDDLLVSERRSSAEIEDPHPEIRLGSFLIALWCVSRLQRRLGEISVIPIFARLGWRLECLRRSLRCSCVGFIRFPRLLSPRS
jgi:hypothetical protein